MLRTLWLIGTIFLASLTTAFAAPPSFYIAPFIEYQGISVSHIDFNGMTPRMSLGYGGAIQESQIYLAAEIFGSPRGVSLHNHKGNTPGLKPKYSLGASLLPGLYLDETILVYARLGIVSTRFDNLDLSRKGYQAGIGLETNISGCWDIRGEYVFTSYDSITGIGSPKGDEYALGVLYKFG